MLAVAAPVFSHLHIAVTAGICALSSLILLLALRRGASARDAFAVGAVVLVTVYVWRAGANMPQLNDDGLPGVSANDMLCPLLTYATVGMYGGIRGTMADRQWETARALVTAITLVVNIVTI